MVKEYLDTDSPWKEILEVYFPQFVYFFTPDVYQEIDWDKGYEFLDKEFQKIFPQSITGRRYVDKLVKVFRKDGTEAFVIIHIEVQGDRVVNFPKRMFVYNYRLIDSYDTKIFSLAVLTDNNPNWRPNKFEQEIWGCKISLEFPIVKLLDYKDKWEELEQNTNPFAVVVMAHLKTLETANDDQKRLEWKLSLSKMLYEKGYSENDVRNLFKFIDWLLMLPKGLNKVFKEEIAKHEEKKKMPYVTSIERLAKEEGIQEGIQEGIDKGELLEKQKVLRKLLSRKFGLTDQESDIISNQQNPELLDNALDEFVFAETKEEVLKHIRPRLKK